MPADSLGRDPCTTRAKRENDLSRRPRLGVCFMTAIMTAEALRHLLECPDAKLRGWRYRKDARPTSISVQGSEDPFMADAKMGSPTASSHFEGGCIRPSSITSSGMRRSRMSSVCSLPAGEGFLQGEQSRQPHLGPFLDPAIPATSPADLQRIEPGSRVTDSPSRARDSVTDRGR